jgi:thioredoxin-related protein
MIVRCMLLLAVLGQISTQPEPSEDGWKDALAPALEEARRDGKDVLVDFTGSDWCHWCKRLDAEVFSHQEFFDGARQNFVLVELDFPREGGERHAAMTEAQHARNRAEAEAFGIESFPTVLLLTPDGVDYAKTGYRQGGPQAYVDHLAELRDSEARDAVIAVVDVLRSEEAPGDRRATAAYELFGRVHAAMTPELVDTLRRFDPEDPRGIVAEWALMELLRAHLDADEPDWKALATDAEVVARETPTIERLGYFHFYSGLAAMHLGDVDGARRRVERARECGDVPDELVQWLDDQIASESAPAG